MKSAVLFMYFLGLVMGYDEACEAKGDTCVGPEDKVNLMQFHAQVHAGKHSKRTKHDMHKILASFEEEEGPMALQELMQGVMALPVLEAEEGMLEAVHAQPQLQHLAKRYPHFLHMMGILEDPKAIQQIKAAVFKEHHSFMNMQGQKPSAITRARRMPVDVELLSKHLQGKGDTTEISLFVWTEGWGCNTNVSFIVNPTTDAEGGEVPMLGPDCSGHPWIQELAVDPDAKGGYYVMGNSSNVDGKWKTSYTMNFMTHDTNEKLFDLTADSGLDGDFNVAANTFTYISTSGSWPDYTWTLMSADLQSKTSTPVMNITDCKWPRQATVMPATGDIIWTCSKDWELENDTNKIMKYSAETAEILTQSENYYGYLTSVGDHIVYSMWNSTDYRNDIYACSIGDCTPEFKGKMPERASWEFFITNSGKLISSVYAGWTGTSSMYNVTATTADGHSDLLFQISNYPQKLQHVDMEVPVDPEEPIPADPATGPPGPAGPPGPPGPPGPGR